MSVGLFDKLPRSRKPRRLMHVDQVHGYGTPVTMKCQRGHELEVDAAPDEEHAGPGVYTASQLNRGIPCARCAETTLRDQAVKF
jgi:hypothetical protein